MNCPICSQPAGFHAPDCGHLRIPPDWRKHIYYGPPNGRVEVIWLDARNGRHITTFLGMRAKPPAWAL